MRRISSRVDRLVVGEVEPQAIRRDQGTLLLDVLAEHRAQPRVHEMGSGVVAGGRATCPTVDAGVDDGAGRQCAAGDHPDVHDGVAVALRIDDFEADSVGRESPAVSDLPADSA